MHCSRSHDAVIRVYDEAGNVIETQEPARPGTGFYFSKIWSVNSRRQIALSNSKKAVNLSSACTTNRYPSSRCASATKIVRPSESTAEMHPQLHPALLSLSATSSQDRFTLLSLAELLESGIGAQWICRARQNFQKASEFFTVASRAYAYGATLHFSVLHGHLSQVRVFSQVLDRAHQHRQGVLPGIHKNLALHCI
jgi:hypothetical protein